MSCFGCCFGSDARQDTHDNIPARHAHPPPPRSSSLQTYEVDDEQFNHNNNINIDSAAYQQQHPQQNAAYRRTPSSTQQLQPDSFYQLAPQQQSQPQPHRPNHHHHHHNDEHDHDDPAFDSFANSSNPPQKQPARLPSTPPPRHGPSKIPSMGSPEDRLNNNISATVAAPALDLLQLQAHHHQQLPARSPSTPANTTLPIPTPRLTPRADSGKRSSRKDLRRNASKASDRNHHTDRAERLERGFSSNGPLAFVRSASSGKAAGYGTPADPDHITGYSHFATGGGGGGGGGVIIDIAASHNTFRESADGREPTDNNGLSRGQNVLKVEKWLRDAAKYEQIDITPRVIKNIEDTDEPPHVDLGEPPTELDRLPPMMPAAQSELSLAQ